MELADRAPDRDTVKRFTAVRAFRDVSPPGNTLGKPTLTVAPHVKHCSVCSP
jgi:hypothetical protein